MSKLNGVAAGISAVSLAITAVNHANMHPFSYVSIAMAVVAVAMGVFAGYAFASKTDDAERAKSQSGGSASA